ncbi:DUF4129 domain-containing protein [Psychroserpens ponticola]|uniref:DUF4129 domain-containing protein n=1 Tax=Psychroserpens ponticola TaxID=2932268 RepID=A0ABY7S3Z7_9FLAO|nr:DUF4129 domain-containing protein [Psychroserpens ponticola]WCO02625.1 DUF4129 domain-containing protein [Psychroserpens ponticola]
MNKFKFLYITLFLFGMSFNSNAVNMATIEMTTLTLQDSIYTDTEARDKRAYENLKEKYSGDEFIYERSIENSGWWSRFKQWLSDVFKDLFSLNSDAKASNVTDIVLKIFYIVIFLLVVYFIVKAIINKEGKWVFGRSSDKSIIPITDIENNIYETDFKALITTAESENNYRLAIRYYYLWLLKTLSKAEIIDYDVEKTNSDYYYEIEHDVTKEEFSYTSYLYNYIWYGEFDIDEPQFNKAKNAFTQFLNSIKE